MATETPDFEAVRRDGYAAIDGFVQQLKDLDEAIRQAVADEREACARLCETSPVVTPAKAFGPLLAAAIRGRGER